MAGARVYAVRIKDPTLQAWLEKQASKSDTMKLALLRLHENDTLDKEILEKLDALLSVSARIDKTSRELRKLLKESIAASQE